MYKVRAFKLCLDDGNLRWVFPVHTCSLMTLPIFKATEQSEVVFSHFECELCQCLLYLLFTLVFSHSLCRRRRGWGAKSWRKSQGRSRPTWKRSTPLSSLSRTPSPRATLHDSCIDSLCFYLVALTDDNVTVALSLYVNDSLWQWHWPCWWPISPWWLDELFDRFHGCILPPTAVLVKTRMN